MTDAIPDDPVVLGRRLREARRAAGLTQEDAAEHLDAVRTTVVAIEKGERAITPSELVRLAGVYGRQVHELLRPDAPVEAFAAQFRLALAHAPEREQLGSHVSQLQQLAEDYIRLERFVGAQPSRSYPPPYAVASAEPHFVGEQIATSERSRLGLGDGPVPRLRELLEQDVGVRVFALELPSSVAGLFAYSDEVGGCIAVNSKHPAERQRWSLAHEYGHFLTNRYKPEVTRLTARRLPATERLAEAFAEHFLMPTSGILRRFNEIRVQRPKGPTPADILQLAQMYEVAMQAMTLRLETLRLVPAGTWDRLAQSGFRVGEARSLLDLKPSPPETERLPLRYRYLATEAFLRGLITEGQFAGFLRTDRLTSRAIAQDLATRLELTSEGDVAEMEVDLGASASEALR